MSKRVLLNFLECSSVEDANLVDLSVYRFERYSEGRGAWLFVARRRVS